MKNTTPLPHTEIASLARQIWYDRGRPQGQDLAIWLDAERSLTDAPSMQAAGASVETHAIYPPSKLSMATAIQPAVATASRTGHPTTAKPPQSSEHPTAASLQADAQKEISRAPRTPTKSSTQKRAVPESGKPIWDKPHST